MSISSLIGNRVEVLVSDPWEFGTECGVGPFVAVVLSATPEILLLRLEAPIEYRGERLTSLVVTPRHAPGRTDPLVSEGQLAANLCLLQSSVATLAELTDDARVGMVAAIGSVRTTNA